MSTGPFRRLRDQPALALTDEWEYLLDLERNGVYSRRDIKDFWERGGALFAVVNERDSLAPSELDEELLALYERWAERGYEITLHDESLYALVKDERINAWHDVPRDVYCAPDTWRLVRDEHVSVGAARFSFIKDTPTHQVYGAESFDASSGELPVELLAHHLGVSPDAITTRFDVDLLLHEMWVAKQPMPPAQSTLGGISLTGGMQANTITGCATTNNSTT